jgi:tripartite-type tricarboxylate transporter receptor subunit TctC
MLMIRSRLCVSVLAGLGLAAPALFFPAALLAQAYPAKPPRFVVPFGPGGVADFQSRALGEAIKEPLGSIFVVDNRGGAGGVIGMEHVAKSPPDGYTLGLGCLGWVTNAVLQKKSPYDPIRDFTPVGMIGSSPSVVVVHPNLPVRNLKEFVALALKRPNDMSFGSSGPGGGSHLSVELFKAQTGTQMVHIPYKTTAQAIPDLLAGRIQFMFDFPTSSLAHIKAGKLRPLAVTSTQRSEILPDVPTMTEAGIKGYEFGTWCGVVAPAGLASPITERLNAAMNKALATPALVSRLGQQAIQATPMSTAQFAAFVRSDIERWRKLLTEGRIAHLD